MRRYSAMSVACRVGSDSARFARSSAHFRANALSTSSPSSASPPYAVSYRPVAVSSPRVPLPVSSLTTFSANARPAPLAARNASVAAVMFATSTIAAPSVAPKTIPDVNAAGCEGNSGSISLSVITKSQSGIVSIWGRVSSRSRTSRARSTASPSEENAANAARDSDACEGGTTDDARASSANGAATSMRDDPSSTRVVGATTSSSSVVCFPSTRLCAKAAQPRVYPGRTLVLDGARPVRDAAWTDIASIRVESGGGASAAAPSPCDERVGRNILPSDFSSGPRDGKVDLDAVGQFHLGFKGNDRL